MAIKDMKGTVIKDKATMTGMMNTSTKKIDPPNLSGMKKLFDKPKQEVKPPVEQSTPRELGLAERVQNLSDEEKALLTQVLSPSVKNVLGKVAKVVLDKPEIEFMVEGHTDNVPISNDCVVDNWDLSVKRATSVVRVLQKDFGVPPSRMTAAGRSSYVPLFDNNTSSNRAKNRRTRIVVLPKLDQFYDLINQGMTAAQ